MLRDAPFHFGNPRKDAVLPALFAAAMAAVAVAPAAAASAASPATRAGAAGRPAALAAAPSIQERGDLLAAPGGVVRTLVLPAAAKAGTVEISWQVVLGDDTVAGGAADVAVRPGRVATLPITFALPAVERAAGLILKITGRGPGTASFGRDLPFTVYPSDDAARLFTTLARGRVALYDPAGAARPALDALGVPFREYRSFEELALDRSDLVVIGPAGFGRGADNLGPILGARARSGARILILQQAELPSTLSEDLRLWPAFAGPIESRVVLDAGHPIVAALPAADGEAFFASTAQARPLVPPSRGNFRVLAGIEMRGGTTWREGIALLEMPVGAATAIVAQAPLCAAYFADPRARILLASTLAYLLSGQPPAPRAYLFGRGDDDLPGCLARLRPALPPAPSNLAGAQVLVVPGGWQAYRLLDDARLPPRADVARFLRDGGTVLLLNPQSMVAEYLQGMLGTVVSFDSAGAALSPAPAAAPLLRGIPADDLPLLGRAGAEEIRLRGSDAAVPVEPLFLQPGLALYRVGGGTLAALTLPEGEACDSPRAGSLLSRLLTNLGVTLDRSPASEPEAVWDPLESTCRHASLSIL